MPLPDMTNMFPRKAQYLKELGLDSIPEGQWSRACQMSFIVRMTNLTSGKGARLRHKRYQAIIELLSTYGIYLRLISGANTETNTFSCPLSIGDVTPGMGAVVEASYWPGGYQGYKFSPAKINSIQEVSGEDDEPDSNREPEIKESPTAQTAQATQALDQAVQNPNWDNLHIASVKLQNLRATLGHWMAELDETLTLVQQALSQSPSSSSPVTIPRAPASNSNKPSVAVISVGVINKSDEDMMKVTPATEDNPNRRKFGAFGALMQQFHEEEGEDDDEDEADDSNA